MNLPSETGSESFVVQGQMRCRGAVASLSEGLVMNSRVADCHLRKVFEQMRNSCSVAVMLAERRSLGADEAHVNLTLGPGRDCYFN